MSQHSLMLEFIPVVSAGSCGIGRFKQEAGGGHRREQGAEAENNEVQVVAMVTLEELLLVPECRRNPENQAKSCGSCH